MTARDEDVPGCTRFDTDSDNSPHGLADANEADRVRDVVSFCNDNNIWYIVSKNPPVRGCRDAAHRRMRLGKSGIPIQDELKSFLGEYKDCNGHIHYVAIHCCGNRMLDMSKVQKLLDSRGCVERLVDPHITKFDDKLYGFINPFILAYGYKGKPVFQIFDSAVQKTRGLPNTMMTNAGSRSIGIEFRPKEVISVLGHMAMVADVVAGAVVNFDALPSIGIITGNPPDSGILLWQHINRRIQDKLGEKFLGDLSYPPVSVRSVPGLGLSMELDRRSEQVWEELEPAVISLCEDGARLLALACHTNHFFTSRIRRVAEQYGAEFISVAEVVEKWVVRNQVTELTLAGINFVSELGEWSAYRDLTRVAKVEPLSEKGLERIHELGYQVKQKGANESGRNQLRSILNDEARTNHVVIALTEMSILLASQRKPGKSGRIIIDALELYGEKIADAYLTLAHPIGL